MNDLPKIRLRALEPEDLDFLYDIENDPELWDISNYTTPYSRYALNIYIANNTCDIYRDGQTRFIIENSDGIAVGMIDLTQFEPHHSRAELGIVIAKKHRQQHYALAAIQGIISYTRDVLHLHQLYSIISKDNYHSIALHEQVGFVKSCLLKEWLQTRNGFSDAYIMQLFFKKDA